MEEMWKITKRTLGSDEKMEFFRWIMECIALNGQNAVWVLGGPGVTSQKIKKNTFNFEGKV